MRRGLRDTRVLLQLVQALAPHEHFGFTERVGDSRLATVGVAHDHHFGARRNVGTCAVLLHAVA